MKTTTTCRAERANPNARNRGLGSRDPYQAASNAAQEIYNQKENAGLTKNDKVNHFHQFLNYFKDNDEKIKNLNKIESSHLDKYAEYLAERVSNEDITSKTASNRISSVNTLMYQINGNDDAKFKSPSEYGIEGRTGIANEDKSVERDLIEEIKTSLSSNHACMLDLQREIGLRFEESAKFNASAAIKSIITGASSITIEDGTKTGRNRTVSLSEKAKYAIERAAEVQQEYRSMIPPDQSYKEFRNECYNVMRDKDISHHAMRHSYAHELYRTGWNEKGYKDIEPPVRAGIEPPAVSNRADMSRYLNERIEYLKEKTGLSKNDVREIEKDIRFDISEKLGHSRVSITNNYLG